MTGRNPDFVESRYRNYMKFLEASKIILDLSVRTSQTWSKKLEYFHDYPNNIAPSLMLDSKLFTDW